LFNDSTTWNVSFLCRIQISNFVSIAITARSSNGARGIYQGASWKINPSPIYDAYRSKLSSLNTVYTACRDALDSAEVRLDCLLPSTRDKGRFVPAKSAFLSKGVKTKLAAHQVQVADVAKKRHPLNNALAEYEAHLQRVVDELGDHVLRPVPVRLQGQLFSFGVVYVSWRLKFYLVGLKAVSGGAKDRTSPCSDETDHSTNP
jgi:hypothetical protein